MTLEEMKKQADNSSSLGAMQAYINALEFRLKELEEGIRKHKRKVGPCGIDWPEDEELYALLSPKEGR